MGRVFHQLPQEGLAHDTGTEHLQASLQEVQQKLKLVSGCHHFARPLSTLQQCLGTRVVGSSNSQTKEYPCLPQEVGAQGKDLILSPLAYKESPQDSKGAPGCMVQACCSVQARPSEKRCVPSSALPTSSHFHECLWIQTRGLVTHQHMLSWLSDGEVSPPGWEAALCTIVGQYILLWGMQPAVSTTFPLCPSIPHIYNIWGRSAASVSVQRQQNRWAVVHCLHFPGEPSQIHPRRGQAHVHHRGRLSLT